MLAGKVAAVCLVVVEVVVPARHLSCASGAYPSGVSQWQGYISCHCHSVGLGFRPASAQDASGLSSSVPLRITVCVFLCPVVLLLQE